MDRFPFSQEKEEQTSFYITNDRTYQENKCKEQEVRLIRKFVMEDFFSFFLIEKDVKILVLFKNMKQFLSVCVSFD